MLIFIIISFLVTLVSTPLWIKRAGIAGLIGVDKHKVNREIPEAGGITVVLGALIGMLFYIAYLVFSSGNIEPAILAALLSIAIAAMIGFVDDILGWKMGLKKKLKISLTFLIAMPIMVVNAGHSTMNLPIIGPIDFGIIFPLLIIPLGIMGASNGFNMIAGFNGLETGMGIIILTTLGLIAKETGSTHASVLAFTLVAGLVAFYFYNKYPARVFPGDTLTYTIGASIAIVSILGNIEKYAVILFIPYYIEFILKARGGMKKESFARMTAQGLLKPYTRYYGLEHISIDIVRKFKKVAEKDVVYVLLFFQLMVAASAILTLIL